MNNQSTKLYTAHVRKSDKAVQPLENHLLEAAEIIKKLATKINSPEADVILIQYRNADTIISAKTLNLADNSLLTIGPIK